MTVAGLLGPAGVANASPAVEPGQIGIESSTLATTCGGTFGNIEQILIISNGGIPAGTTWQVRAAVSEPWEFRATPDSPLVSVSRISRTMVELEAVTTLPSGTVVTVTPSYFTVGSVIYVDGSDGSYLAEPTPWC